MKTKITHTTKNKHKQAKHSKVKGGRDALSKHTPTHTHTHTHTQNKAQIKVSFACFRPHPGRSRIRSSRLPASATLIPAHHPTATSATVTLRRLNSHSFGQIHSFRPSTLTVHQPMLFCKFQDTVQTLRLMSHYFVYVTDEGSPFSCIKSAVFFWSRPVCVCVCVCLSSCWPLHQILLPSL